MPTRTSTLDLTLPGAIVEYGNSLAESRGLVRSRPGTNEATGRLGDAEDLLLAQARANPTVRSLTGIRGRGQGEAEQRLRLRAFAMMAFRALCQVSSQSVCEVAELASACLDPTLPPGEAVLLARDVIGRMAVEETLVAVFSGEDGPCTKVVLPARSQEWLAGGKASLGFLTGAKVVGAMLPGGFDQACEPSTAPMRMPTAKELCAKICERVVGLDEQASALSSRLVLHLARAKMLKLGSDPGTGNQAILLAGNSSCGKTFLMSEAARVSGCPFATASATAWTSEGFVGGKVDDLFRALVMRAKGDCAAARYGVAFADEWDKKAIRFGRDIATTSIQQEMLVPMQGAEFPISGKRGNERQVIFDSRGTSFVFAGAFTGLRELIRKRTSSSCIGFSSNAATPQQMYVLDAIRDYGFIREWVGRLTAVMFLPDPSPESLEKAAAGGLLDSFNALVSELDLVLFPHPDAIPRMVEYAFESRTFYRGLKSVWWSIAESAVASGEKGTVLVGASDIESAIGRVASGAIAGDAATLATAGRVEPASGPISGDDEAGSEGQARGA